MVLGDPLTIFAMGVYSRVDTLFSAWEGKAIGNRVKSAMGDPWPDPSDQRMGSTPCWVEGQDRLW